MVNLIKYLKLFESHADYAAYIGGSDKVLPNVSYCEDNNDVHYNTDKRVIVIFNVTSISSPTKIASVTSHFSEIEIDGVVQQSVVGTYQFDTTGEHIVKYTLVDPTSGSGGALWGCTEITSVILPSNAMFGGAFLGDCTGLTTITVNGCKLSGGAFSQSTNITSVTLNRGFIGASAFNGCTGITTMTINGGTVDGFPFNLCPNFTTYVVGSNTKYKVENSCLIEKNTNKLVAGCKNGTISNTVTSIGNYAFYYCSGLTSITIPDSVTSISNYAFSYCSGLTSVTIQATTPPTLGNSNAFNNTNNCPIYVPSASVAAYKAATNWSSLSSRIQAIP